MPAATRSCLISAPTTSGLTIRRASGSIRRFSAILATTPLPNNFTTGDGLNTAGYTFAAPEEEKQMDFVTKIDHTFNTRITAPSSAISKGYQNTLCDSVNGGQPAFPGTACLVNTDRDPV